MSGDHTRFSFDPRRRFVAVTMQQGRVQLDSDWNEQADLLRERTRLLGLDNGGPAWLPVATTPKAFLVGALAGPPADLSLEPGRIYVDGRLAEIFPGEGVTYLRQPFLPAPPPLTPGVDTIVYLDLWEREVTWAEMPALLDVALGGIDTTTRIQQVWQVKLHAEAGMGSCGVDLDALFPPSAGRLTTSANAPPAPDDPCILPPSAGYRGIENRLYRVEVQTAGTLGTARFKWSRDNGSIVSRVSAIAVAGGQTRLTVNRIGRDGTLAFRINDWVTLTDDVRELNGEAGQMARIVDIDQAARVIVLDRAVPSAGRPFGTGAAIADRNTRLQRWDESAPLNTIDGDGLMAIAAGPILLEDGVQVAFSLAVSGGTFHVGDYWVFAARTADASVEILTAAPPRGIRHQYLQIAAIPAGAAPTDCRPAAKSNAGCCTFVVRPGENIQAAINALPPAGGCICLKAGLHVIDTPLLLQRDNVTLHGESLGAILLNRRGTGLIVVAGAEHDRIHDLTLEQGEAAAAPVIVIEGCEDLAIADCRVRTAPRADSTGIFAVATRELAITGCDFQDTALGVWLDKGCELVTIAGCAFRLAAPGPNVPETVAILARTMRGPLFAETNIVSGAIEGIVVNDGGGAGGSGPPMSRATGSRICHNEIGLVAVTGPTRRCGIDAAAAAMLVTGNHVVHAGGNVAGIRLSGSGSSATGNVVVSQAKVAGGSIAIVAGEGGAGKFLPLERVIVSDNVIEGRQSGIVLTGVARGIIAGNILGRDDAGLIFGILLLAATDMRVAGNEIVGATLGLFALQGARNALRDNGMIGGGIGIALTQEVAPLVGGNRITGAAQFGILVIGITERCEITDNRVVRCGGRTQLFAGGIICLVVLGELHAVGNEVMDIGVAKAGLAGGAAAVALGIAGLYILEARVTDNLVTYSSPTLRPPTGEDRALLMQGWIETAFVGGAGRLVAGFGVQIGDNKFIGTGATALVELREQVVDNATRLRFERVLFCGNYCTHFSMPFADNVQAATVSLVGRQCSVSANHVKATTPAFRSWHLHGMAGPFIGNVSHERGWDRSPAAGFPAPEQNFNLIA